LLLSLEVRLEDTRLKKEGYSGGMETKTTVIGLKK